MMDVSIRIAGEAGQGVQTTGNLLVSALAGMGIHVFATQSYMSRIRGGLNWFDIRIGENEMFSRRESVDVLVALTEEALDVLRPAVLDRGAVLYDGPSQDGAISLEFSKLAKEVAGTAITANSVAAGAVFALLGYDVEPLCDHFKRVFKKKGEDELIARLQKASEEALKALENAEAKAEPEEEAKPEPKTEPKKKSTKRAKKS